jgi:hypothetical protein
MEGVVSDRRTAPAGQPRKLLFLADSYLRDALWPPFHQNTIRALSAGFDEILAVRTNSFFHNRSHLPRSDADRSRLVSIVRDFAPDVVFSINRTGLAPAVIAAVGEQARIVTLFIDFFERFTPQLHEYTAREYVWLLGNKKLEASFHHRYGHRLRPNHVIATHWCADHHAFYPTGVPRTIDAVYVGTPFGSLPFAEIVDAFHAYPANRAALLAVHELHKRSYVYDWLAALRQHGFDFQRVPAKAAEWLRDGQYLSTAASDQLTAEVRVRFLSALAGLDLRIYGTPTLKWIQNIGLVDSKLFRHFQFRGVDDPVELAGLYNSARIGVNIQHDNARGHGMSFRVYEIMACKALLATHADATEPLTEMGFVEGVDFVDFADPAELRRKCDYFLAHSDERQQIIESAYAKLRSRHTVALRLAEMFDRCGEFETRDRFLTSTRTGAIAANGKVRHIPEQLPTLPPPEAPSPDSLEALTAEIAALRSSWALRLGTWMLAPARPVKRLLRRAA